jgi:metallophosphoesterase superfamily enzyme
MQMRDEDLAHIARLELLLTHGHERGGAAIDEKEVVGAAHPDAGLETAATAEGVPTAHKANFDRSHAPRLRG